MAKPIPPDARFARVDQGVDYQSTTPYLAIGPGTVYAVKKGFAGGTGDSVYYRLDTPVTVNGRTYRDVYIAEQHPLVKVGDRVVAGQQIMAAGGVEMGFAKGAGPAAPLVGGLGAGTKPTRQGQDFLDFVNGSHTAAPVAQPQTAQPAAAQPVTSPAFTPPPAQAPPGAAPSPQPDVEMPGSQSYTIGQPHIASSLWSQVNQGEFVSPEAQMLSQNALVATGG